MSEPESKNAVDRKGERLDVRLALTATAPESSTEEVTTEQFIGLREGTLTPDEKRRVVELLDSSESAYREWLAFNRYLDEEGAKQPRVPRPRHLGRLAWVGGSAAAGLLLAVILILGQPPTLERAIDRSYARASATGIVSASGAVPDLATLAGSGYEMSASDPGSMARRALSAGLWAGAAALSGDADASYPVGLLPANRSGSRLGQAPWQESDWASYAELGRWLVLLAAACREPQPGHQGFWHQQSMLRAQVTDALAATEGTEVAKPVLRQLAAIEAPIGQLAAGAAPERPCDEIVRAAQRLAAFGHPAGR